MQTTPMQMRVAFQTPNPCHCLWIDEGHCASCHPPVPTDSLVCHFHFNLINATQRMPALFLPLPLSTPLSGQTFILSTKASLCRADQTWGKTRSYLLSIWQQEKIRETAVILAEHLAKREKNPKKQKAGDKSNTHGQPAWCKSITPHCYRASYRSVCLPWGYRKRASRPASTRCKCLSALES
jgi:hypothetical protein